MKSNNEETPESHISATIDKKRPSTYIPVTSLLSIPDVTRVVDEYGKNIDIDYTQIEIVRKAENKIPYSAEAEGHKKLGLLWRLVMNKSIVKDTVLFWDEPEASLNPRLFPVVVDVLMELARNGVQMFLATHEYNFMKYFKVKKRNDDQVAFTNLYKTENGVEGESEDDYRLLEHNAIVEANIKLLEDDIEGVF